MNRDDAIKIRDEIIEAMLPHVVFDGWTWDGLLRAAQEAGHDELTVQAVFPGKMIDVLDGFSDMADHAMLESLMKLDPEKMRVRDRVRAGVLARFEFLQPHKEALRKSLAFWALPPRKLRAGKIVWRTSDRIWAWAGDTARDYNRYTKRGLLSGIIVSTTLVWLDDSGEDMSITKDFLDRRIENVMQLGQMIGKIKKAA